MAEPGTDDLFCHREVVEPFAENAWLLGCRSTRKAVLVDPGGNVPQLLRVAAEQELEIGSVWLTHAHLDHVTGVGEVVAATGVPVLLHRDDLPLYRAVPQQAAMFGLAAEAQPGPDGWLVEGHDLSLGELRARVLFVPGHSPGHVAFWFEEQALVVSGDVLFAGSIGRTDLPGGSYETLMRSIESELLPRGDDVTVLPGHGPDTTIGRERRDNPFLHGLGLEIG